MSLKHGILGFLNYGDMTGYELDKAFKKSLDFFWHAQTSQIYRELAGLEKEGLVSSKLIYQTDKPNKKEYSITEAGKREFIKWISQDVTIETQNMKNAFLLKVFFWGERPVQGNIQMLKKFKKDCEGFLASMSEIEQSIDFYKDKVTDEKKTVYWGITASFGYYYVHMCMQWAEDTIKRLEERVK